MCGIAGKIYRSSEREMPLSLIQSMTRAIAHRGPDDEGFYLSRNVGLGMRRLSIIDLPGGRQPISNEDKTVWVVFNGEIYNYREIREGLQKKGHRFATESDTEVIVHLYEEKGVEALQDLRGMFAFALWDTRRERLFLARDRVGKKPLCYALTDEGLVFGSEIKALLADRSVPREVDLEGLDLYLSFQFVPSPRSLFRGINKLPPAHYLIWERGEVTVAPYWEVSSEKIDIPFEEAKERLFDLLNESIRLRLISDVPVGGFLSGGVDSSMIVGLMSRLTSEPVQTFSVGFEEDAYNELPFARKAAEAFKTDHHEYLVRADVAGLLPKLVWHYDEPFADKSAVPTFYLCQKAAKEVKVVLSGDGGDEAFAGYSKYLSTERGYLSEKVSDWFQARWGKKLLGALWEGEGSRLGYSVRRKLFRSFIPAAPSLFYTEFFDGMMKRDLLKKEIRTELRHQGIDQLSSLWEETRRKVPSVLDQMLRIDAAWYLPGDLLVKTDIASMAHGLEVRCPFLDYKLLEFAFSLPPCYKVAGNETKLLLKRLAASYIPNEIVTRKKTGFGLPLKEWLRGDLRGLVQTVLLDPSIATDRYFNRSSVERLVKGHLSGKENHTFRLWALILFNLWHKRFIEDELNLEL